MRLLNESFEPIIERWDDPGDYPSGAGSGPLPSYDYVAEVEGSVTIELEDSDLCEILNQNYDPELSHDIRVTLWEVVKIEGRKVTFGIREFDADVC